MTVQRIWPAINGPNTSGSDGQAINLATEFEVTVPAWVTSLWFYRGTIDVQPDNLRLYRVDSATTGTVLAELSAPVLGATLGWREFPLVTPVPLTVGQAYRVAGHFPSNYTATGGYWTGAGPGGSGITNGFLVAPDDATATASDQGSFNYDAVPRMPDNSFGGGNYWMDVSVTDVDPTAEEPTGAGTTTVVLATTIGGAKRVDSTTGTSLTLTTLEVGEKRAASARTSPLTLGGAALGESIRGSARTSALVLASSSTGGPVTGPIPAVVSPVLCAPWATPADVPAAIRTELGITDDQLAVQLMRASELLWMLTGRIWYGIGCSEEVTLRSLPTSAPWRGDWITHSSWGECPCWMTSGSVVDHIAQPRRVKLPRSPVQAITSVTVEGVLLDPTAYRLNHAGVLERTDGGLWQVCAGETVIVYTYGEAPPAGGRDAAVTLGVEFARDFHGIAGCRLPSNVTSLTRQEVTTTYADPNEFLEKGLTGLRSVDLWVKAINPHNRPQRARVYSPDVPRTNRRNLP